MPNINKGIIGTGEFAKKYYFPAFVKHNNVKIAAVANRTLQKGYQIAEKYGIEQVFIGESGWEKIIESKNKLCILYYFFCSIFPPIYIKFTALLE